MDHDENISLLIVDDHRIVIDGILLMLADQQHISCLGTAESGEEALEFLETQPVDVVLLDVNMPGMGGIQTCKRIRKMHPHIKILILSMFKEINMVTSTIRAGAQGYVLKSEGQEEVIKAIVTIYEKGEYFSEEVRRLIRYGDLIKKKSGNQFIPKLSRREQQILELILDELTTQEIAERLTIAFNTVESYRKNLLAKLGARNTAGMVRIALENGLV